MSDHNKPKLSEDERYKVLTDAMAEIKKEGKHRSLNEVKDYHPLVAEWLTANGYTYEHHYRMDDFGIVDFLATHADGHKVLVEAKCVRAKVKSAILQVKVYQTQMPDAEAAVIAPPEFLLEKDFPMAEKHGVNIYTVALSDALKERINKPPIKVAICDGCGQPVYYHMQKKDGKVTAVVIGNTIDGKVMRAKHAWPPLPGEEPKYELVSKR